MRRQQKQTHKKRCVQCACVGMRMHFEEVDSEVDFSAQRLVRPNRTDVQIIFVEVSSYDLLKNKVIDKERKKTRIVQ